MDRDFFNIFRFDYSIDQKLPEELASKVKLALRLAEVHYVEDGLDVVESNPVDAYFQMIVKLHERGLLSK